MSFNDIFKSSFLENVTAVSITDMALALVLSFCLGLFIFFAIVMLFKVFSVTWIHKHSRTVTFAGAMTAASFTACFFAMGFDNVITYAQQGFVIPFVMLGIFYKSVDLKL